MAEPALPQVRGPEQREHRRCAAVGAHAGRGTDVVLGHCRERSRHRGIGRRPKADGARGSRVGGAAATGRAAASAAWRCPAFHRAAGPLPPVGLPPRPADSCPPPPPVPPRPFPRRPTRCPAFPHPSHEPPATTSRTTKTRSAVRRRHHLPTWCLRLPEQDRKLSLSSASRSRAGVRLFVDSSSFALARDLQAPTVSTLWGKRAPNSAAAARASSVRPAPASERTRSASRSSASQPLGKRRACSSKVVSAISKSWRRRRPARAGGIRARCCAIGFSVAGRPSGRGRLPGLGGADNTAGAGRVAGPTHRRSESGPRRSRSRAAAGLRDRAGPAQRWSRRRGRQDQGHHDPEPGASLRSRSPGSDATASA